jgi:hypothetical protein
MVKIKKRYIRIIIGFLLPLLIMNILLILGLYFSDKPLNKILFFLFYTPFILFIPLLIYSYFMDLVVIPRFYKCTWCILLISMVYGLFLLLLPFWIGGESLKDMNLESFIILIQVAGTGLISGYVLKKIVL